MIFFISTAVKTSNPTKKVVAGRVKQVNHATSAEEGTLVTTCCFISAAGNTILPAMVLTHVHFK
jgi:dihydroorotase-like cyclic amidohydrolase